MMWEKKAVALLSLVTVWTFAGCETDSAEKIAKLQEQVARITQQLNDTKKQVDGLQEANQRSVQAVENLSATIARLSLLGGPHRRKKSGKRGC
jgi:septal ring factor EnvC (AmiA/AmiB activator)